MTFAEACQKLPGDCRRYDPCRTPSWRWEIALEHMRRNDRVRPWEDLAIKEAVRYLRERQRAQTARQVSNLRDRWRDLTRAQEIFEAGGVLRDEIEARLISGETFEVISTKTHTTPGAVSAFERYFFNVADSLNALDWMLVHAVGIHPGLRRKLEERDIWRYMALAGGPVLVDLLVDDFLGRPNPTIPNRHEQAKMARFLVKDYVTDWGSKKAGAATFKEGQKLFGPYVKNAGPEFKLAVKGIKLFYGLLRPRKSRRQQDSQVEATAAEAKLEYGNAVAKMKEGFHQAVRQESHGAGPNTQAGPVGQQKNRVRETAQATMVQDNVASVRS